MIYFPDDFFLNFCPTILSVIKSIENVEKIFQFL